MNKLLQLLTIVLLTVFTTRTISAQTTPASIYTSPTSYVIPSATASPNTVTISVCYGFSSNLDGGAPTTMTISGVTKNTTEAGSGSNRTYCASFTLCNAPAVCETVVSSVPVPVTLTPGNGGAAISTSFVALPIELAAFRATPKKNDVEVTWTTASESNNDRFMLQEKVGNTWVTLTEVKGKGTSIISHTYNKVLQNLPAGLHTFRLAQVDFDGKTSYSETTQALIELKDYYAMTNAYPNPFNPTTQFALTVAQDQDVRVVLYDMTGREVAVMHNGLMRANEINYIRVDASHLPSGTYFYQASSNFFKATKTLTLTK